MKFKFGFKEKSPIERQSLENEVLEILNKLQGKYKSGRFFISGTGIALGEDFEWIRARLKIKKLIERSNIEEKERISNQVLGRFDSLSRDVKESSVPNFERIISDIKLLLSGKMPTPSSDILGIR